MSQSETDTRLYEDIGSLKSDVKRLLEDGKERSASIHMLAEAVTDLKDMIERLEPRIAKGEEAAEVIDTMKKQGKGWLIGVAMVSAFGGSAFVATFYENIKQFFAAVGK